MLLKLHASYIDCAGFIPVSCFGRRLGLNDELIRKALITVERSYLSGINRMTGWNQVDELRPECFQFLRGEGAEK